MRKIIIVVVIAANKIFALRPKLEDEKTLGIIKKIEKGFVIPPVKKTKKLNWEISINKKMNA